MNPNTIRILAAAGGGAIVGSVSTFFVTRYFVAKKWKAIAEEEIESVKESYRLVRTDPSTLLTDEHLAAIEAEAAEDAANGVERDEFGEVINHYGRQEAGDDFDPDYPRDKSDEELAILAKKISDLGYAKAQAVIGEIQDRGLDTNDAIREVDRAAVEAKVVTEVRTEVDYIAANAVTMAPDGTPRDRSRPYVISILEFAEPEDEFMHYENAEISYFAGDRTLLDSKQEIVMDKEGLVGTDNLNQFGRMSEDPDIVYVRNEQMDMTFEIHLHHVGYAESKGMYVDPDTEDTYKTKRRQKALQEE